MNFKELLKEINVNEANIKILIICMPDDINITLVDGDGYELDHTFHAIFPSDNMEKTFEDVKATKLPFSIDLKYKNDKYYSEYNNGNEICYLYNEDGTSKIVMSKYNVDEILDEYNKNLIKVYKLMEKI